MMDLSKPTGAIGSLHADRSALLDICTHLSDENWKAPSGCAGWTVKDVVTHMGALFWAVVDPSVLPDTTGLPTERAQDVCVESRRHWSADQIVADYGAVSAEAIERLSGLGDLDVQVALGDLGTFPAYVLPSGFSFDHFVHIRFDLFPPRGPLSGQPPPSDALRMEPTLDWITAALPQQNPDQYAALTSAIEIELSGPCTRTIRIGNGENEALISSTAPAFVAWITQRSTWDEAGVVSVGDPQALALARTLKVI